MAYAQEMKNLVADIKTSHRDRTEYLSNLKGDTKKLIARLQGEIKDIKGDIAGLLAQYDKEMKELAADLKDFLKKSEATRMADFKLFMEPIRKQVKDLLAEYRAERKEAAGYWGRLRARGEVAPTAEEAPAAPKRKRGRRGK